MALGLAHLLNYRLRADLLPGRSMLAPYATSVAAAALVFATALRTRLRPDQLGAAAWSASSHIDWENGKWTSQIAISTIVIWRWTGYNALIYLAAMQADPGRPVRGGGARRRLAAGSSSAR